MNYGMEHAIGAVLPIRVWGTDAQGSIFRESVSARDVTERGALLDGLTQKLHLGDLVGVEYNNRKAHARITGIEEASSTSQLCSVQLLDNAACPWQGALPKIVQEAPPPPKERRRYVRHKIPIGLEIRQESGVPLHVRATDVSPGGCYVETMLPMKKGAEMEVTIWLESGRIVTKAIVRTSDVAVGMGIEFIGMTAAETDLLDQFIKAQVAMAGSASPLH